MIRETSRASAANSSLELTALLKRAEACLGALKPAPSRTPPLLASLRERLVEERLQVAVLGQFKRGKSTFLNALLGESLLPTGVVPVTAIATFIRWAASPSIRVFYRDGRPAEEPAAAGSAEIRAQLARFVSEENNPKNRLKVARVDLLYPAPILENGIVLIDTPGVGSTLRHNTDAAFEVLPECDAGFFVLSVDPPVTEAELLYLERLRPHVARLFFVLNKIDAIEEDELGAACEFLRASLREHVPLEAEAPLFSLSARRALAARQKGEKEGIEESGLLAIERHLVEFLAREKVGSLQRAVALKAGALLDGAQMDVALLIRALEMPIEDLERRAGEFAEALSGIERERLVARDLLMGDRRRALEVLEKEAAALRREAREALFATLDRTLDAAPQRAEEAAKSAIAAAIPEFFEEKLDSVSREFALSVEAILRGHVARAEALLARVRESAAALFEITSAPFADTQSFVIRREPYWVTEKWADTLFPVSAGVFERLLPSQIARQRRRLAAEVDELIERNVENLRWATLQNLESAFHRFAAWFEARLAEAIEATRGAIEAARKRRREHAEKAREELLAVRQAAASLKRLREQLAQSDPQQSRP